MGSRSRRSPPFPLCVVIVKGIGALGDQDIVGVVGIKLRVVDIRFNHQAAQIGVQV